MTLLAKVYAVLVSVLILYAWYTDITLLYSSHEHLGPDMLLALVSIPASLSLTLLPGSTAPLIQLAWLTVCAAA